MAVVSGDVITYLAANHAEDDSSTQGGAIDSNGRPIDDQFASAAAPEVVSDNAGDTQNCTIVGRKVDGTIGSETNALTGVTPVLFSTTFERILKVSLASNATGVITVKQGSGGTTRHTFAAGEDLARTLFYGASAEPSGGSSVVNYEKVFVKNTHGSLAALQASIEIQTDAAGYYDIALATSDDDSESTTNRLTAPSAVGSFGDGPLTVPNTDLGSGVAIGVWVKQTLAAGLAGSVDEITVRTNFKST